MKLKRKDCLICDRKTNLHLTICDDCYNVLVPKKEKVTKGFKYVDEAYSCFYYSPLVSETLRRYKFGNQRYFYLLFSELILEKIVSLKLYRKFDVLIPIPLHKKTLLKRGFNQIDLLTKYLATNLKKDNCTDVLLKTKFTKEQAMLNSIERKANLSGAFSIENKEKIQQKNILLIDDMITTGTTVEECAKILKSYGAKTVLVVSIATTT
ncbi:MAG: ComF family protein [Tissierellia bacterium]|jgi:competence protein ComFC|nr:ComF family protein [Tissierellia bacterium]